LVGCWGGALPAGPNQSDSLPVEDRFFPFPPLGATQVFSRMPPSVTLTKASLHSSQIGECDSLSKRPSYQGGPPSDESIFRSPPPSLFLWKTFRCPGTPHFLFLIHAFSFLRIPFVLGFPELRMPPESNEILCMGRGSIFSPDGYSFIPIVEGSPTFWVGSTSSGPEYTTPFPFAKVFHPPLTSSCIHLPPKLTFDSYFSFSIEEGA